jgi:DNA-binding XRE family transcriptional regulator
MNTNEPKKARLDLLLTQEQLAEKAGISRAVISHCENTCTWPIHELTRHKYARALGIDPASVEMNQIHSVTVSA